MKPITFIIFLILLGLVLFVLEIALGSVTIPVSEVIGGLMGDSENPTTEYIITDIRLPRAVMAVLSGAGLSLAGLLMQTLFRNPLAGPFVLGISSGAGLGVALLLMGSGVLAISGLATLGMVGASMLGSLAVLGLIIFISLRIRDMMGLLIIGLMMGSLTSAVVGILSYFAPSEELQRYVFWSLGGLAGLQWDSIGILGLVILMATVATLFILKPLNLLLMGPSYAQSLGVYLRLNSWIIIIITSAVAGSITAYAGPIAFVGLAAPHMVRLFLKTVDHRLLLPVGMLMGINIMLLCDLVASLPTLPMTLPINAVTSLLGAPLVIWLILKRKRLNF